MQQDIMEKAIGDISESAYRITTSTIKRIVDNTKDFLPEIAMKHEAGLAAR